jgi:HlyD family secretion protein
MAEQKGFFRRHKKLFLFFLVIAVIAVIIIFNLQSQREKSIKVSVEKVKRHDLTSVISASGEVKPKKNVNISSQIAGRVILLGVEEGQQVKTGDFLLKLESTQYEANADRDKARIQSLQADLIRAEAVKNRDDAFYKRQIKLFDAQLISTEALESAKANYEISKANCDAINFQIKQAQASLQSTLDILKKTEYYAPIEGIITSLQVEEGETALVGTMNNPGTILMTIADLSVMEVEVEVDETDVVGVKIGQPSEVKIDAYPEDIISGTVTEVGSSAIQTVTTADESKDFKVVVTLENPPADLKPGLSASADIIVAKKEDVLAVPISALVLQDKSEEDQSSEKDQVEGVYIVQQGRAKFVPIKKGIMGELMIEITSGLEEEQDVIVGPYSALRLLKDDTLIKPEEKTEE